MRMKHFALMLTIAVICGVMIVTAQQGTAVAPYTAAQAAAGRASSSSGMPGRASLQGGRRSRSPAGCSRSTSIGRDA